MGARAARRWRLPRALPPLRGAAWWLFLLVWTVSLGFALYSVVLSATRPVQPPVSYLYGVAVQGAALRGDDHENIVQFVLGPEPLRAGLRPGQRITAVNGRALTDGFSFAEVVEALGEPAIVHLATRSPDSRAAVRSIARSPAYADDLLAGTGLTYLAFRRVQTIGYLSADVLLPVAFATLLLLRRARDPLAPWVSLAFLVQALAIGPEGFYLAQHGGAVLRWATRLYSPLGSWLLIATLALFPTARFTPRWSWAVLAGSLPLTYWLRLETPTIPSNIALLTGLFAAVATVWARYRAMPPGVGRQQIRWALFGFFVSLLGLLLMIVDQRIYAVVADAETFSLLKLLEILLDLIFGVSLAAGMTLGLMRYRLYDADATISRSVAYGAITLSLLAVFAGSEKVIEILGEEYFGSTLGALAGGLGAAIAAVMVVPFHHWVTHWAERRFRTGLVNLRHGLPLLVANLRETTTPVALADAVLLRVEKGVRAQHGAVVAGDAVLDARDIDAEAVGRWLAANPLPVGGTADLVCRRGDDLFPLRVPLRADGVGPVGWLLLGLRPDGTFYGREERAALREIADPVTRALAIAFDRERREAAHRAQEEARAQAGRARAAGGRAAPLRGNALRRRYQPLIRAARSPTVANLSARRLPISIPRSSRTHRAA